jgi:arylsulfatase A-like enzyme
MTDANMNVILIVLDSLSADHVGCYGNTWIKTPNLDAFAEENALFEKFSPESLPTTLPISGPYGLFGRGMVQRSR